MLDEKHQVSPLGSGLLALTLVLRIRGEPVDADRVRDRCGAIVGLRDMLRASAELGLAAELCDTTWDKLSGVGFPAVAALRDGAFLILVSADADGVVAHDGADGRQAMDRADFERIWDGRLVLIAPATDGRLRPPEPMDPVETDGLYQPAEGEAQPAAGRGEEAADTNEPTKEDSNPAGGSSGSAQVGPGLGALVMLLRFHGVGADPEQIRHSIGAAKIGVTEMVRCARQMGLKARASSSNWSRLANTPLPGIAVLTDGGFLILGKASDDKALVQRPGSTRPEVLTRADFEAIWDRRLILMARRASLLDLTRRFDITWFLGALHKYRRLLSEVLLASFFLQVFALVSPLFFQVVIDKVLVHRSMSTLDVLVIGLVTISVFEAALGVLRTYLFAHTTNRIDVELGAQLFRHLMALPIAYFQSRRVGNSVARVRELENIRQFLTGSALTLVVDLVFTFVFLAVMFYYSPMMTGVVLASFPFYIAISAGATPLFRRRLDEKFRRGSENQAFLVESVTGVETLKAMAVEPQMQRRWEEQLAGYVAASFRVISLNNTASQGVQLINKLVIADGGLPGIQAEHGLLRRLAYLVPAAIRRLVRRAQPDRF